MEVSKAMDGFRPAPVPPRVLMSNTPCLIPLLWRAPCNMDTAVMELSAELGSDFFIFGGFGSCSDKCLFG